MKHIGRSCHGWLVIVTALLSITGCLEKSESEGFTSDAPVIGDPGPSDPGPSDPGPSDPGPGSPDPDVSFSVSTSSGVIPLEVQFTSPQHSEISEYLWSFDDGTMATGPAQTHTFAESGTYMVTLTATATDGTQFTAQQRINAFASINNADAIVPGTALFFDSFEYEAGREDAGVTSIFQDHGWATVKTQQVQPDRHPLGYVYTTDTVPGYEGGMLPGANSTRVVAMEALPTTLGVYEGPDTFWGNMQTDFYLQYGGENEPSGTVPANVWFQFWMYTTGGMTGGFTRSQNKFLYPCNGSYPCQNESWLQSLGTTSANPNWVELSNNSEPIPDVFLRLRGTGAAWTPGYDAGEWFGHTNTSELILGQRWVLVRIHIDTSGSQGIYEVWLRPMGGREVKVAEHIGGVTPGFDWPISDNSGHRVLRMPTTFGDRYIVDNYPESYDVTIYLDDFTIANSEDDLPQYPY